MYGRRAFLTAVSAFATVSLAGCSEDESSTEPSDPESEPESQSNSAESETKSEPESATEQPKSESGTEPGTETESGIDDDSRSDLGPIEVAEQFFTAIDGGNENKVYELSHPEVRDVLVESYSEPQNLGVLDTIEKVSEEEATTGEQSAPDTDINGVEELLAGGMATEVQWLLITFTEVEGEFYVPLLKYDGSWFYYEHV
jgi:hypothetical protein